MAILKLLKHRNIVTCIDFYAEDKTYYLVLEYMEGGELFDRIVKKSFYNEREARDVVFTLLSAIEYCHSHDIVHRYAHTHTHIHTHTHTHTHTHDIVHRYTQTLTNSFIHLCGIPVLLHLQIDITKRNINREMTKHSVNKYEITYKQFINACCPT